MNEKVEKRVVDGREALVKKTVCSGNDVVVACDGRCEKAWGISTRPRTKADEFMADSELALAPKDPGTLQCGQAKPREPHKRLLSKWCMLECERSVIAPPSASIVLVDFSKRQPIGGDEYLSS